MKSKNVKKVVSYFLVGIILGIATMVAFAGTATGQWGGYGPQLGYEYKNQNTVYDYGIPSADITVRNKLDATVPTGYMGCKPRIYLNSALYGEGSISYNNDPVISMTSLLATSSSAPTGNYYSKGLSYAFNGSTYNTYDSFASPSITH